MAGEVDSDMQTQIILLAAAHHNLEELRPLLRQASASVQDSETGFTPLHAAIAACAPESQQGLGQRKNGQPNDEITSEDLDGAVKTVKLLLQNGAIWNDLDSNGETPGCLAYRLGLGELYELMVDAGVRAELLLSHLDEYERMEYSGEDSDEGMVDENKPAPPAANLEAKGFSARRKGVDVKSDEYLRSELTFQDDKLLDAEANGVMMAWEADIMKRTADLLLPKPGLRVLNVGHGLGIIDEYFQSQSPISHHIIEAHPAVLGKLRKDGWHEKSGVVVHEGRWQDVLPKLIRENVMLDAIYFDTFAEDYKALREFFSEYVIGLLDPQGEDGSGGRWGFFNGMGADRRICYDVYTKVYAHYNQPILKMASDFASQVVELDLFEAGFDTEWEEISVPDLNESGEWEGVRRRYWVLDRYRLPICRFLD
ncbi:MAG: Arginine N-methyltransferase 2 [Geoglossum simile]|nr:MAG: Arginine N-methyltransferase 2 [Geoglossum simile]